MIIKPAADGNLLIQDRAGGAVLSTTASGATIVFTLLFIDFFDTAGTLTSVANVSGKIGKDGKIQDVEKAIQKSDLGLNPQVEGSVIRLRLPELTEDRRRELVKQIKKQVEDGKVSIRNIRRDEVEQVKLMEKEKEISEDESKRQQDDVQKITDDYISKMDILSKEKESDIMKV